MVHFTSIIAILAATTYALPTPEAEPVEIELEKRCTGPNVNQATLTLTKSFEGYRASACKLEQLIA